MVNWKTKSFCLGKTKTSAEIKVLKSNRRTFTNAIYVKMADVTSKDRHIN